MSIEKQENKLLKLFEENLHEETTSTPIDLARIEVDALLPEAVKVFKQVLIDEASSLDLKFKAAKTIIDLSPISSIANSDKKVSFIYNMIDGFTPEQILELKTTADLIISNWRGKKSSKLLKK